MGSLFGRWLEADNSNETARENNARESGLFLFLVPHSASFGRRLSGQGVGRQGFLKTHS